MIFKDFFNSSKPNLYFVELELMDPNSWCYTDSAVESLAVKEALWGGQWESGGDFPGKDSVSVA